MQRNQSTYSEKVHWPSFICFPNYNARDKVWVLSSNISGPSSYLFNKEVKFTDISVFRSSVINSQTSSQNGPSEHLT